MEEVATRYAGGRNAQIAYQVRGESGPGLVSLTGTFPGLAVAEEPLSAPYWDRLVSFSRTVVHDARGTGRSDPLSWGKSPSVDDQVGDLITVLDHAG